MRKKLLIYGGAAVAVAILALLATTVFAEKVGVAKMVVQKGVVHDKTTWEKALANSAACAGFKITEVKAMGQGKVLATIAVRRGGCCLDPAIEVLAKMSGVEKVQVTLLRKSEH